MSILDSIPKECGSVATVKFVTIKEMEGEGKDWVKERHLISKKNLILLLDHFDPHCSVTIRFYFLAPEISTNSLMKMTLKYNHFTSSINVKDTI